MHICYCKSNVTITNVAQEEGCYKSASQALFSSNVQSAHYSYSTDNAEQCHHCEGFSKFLPSTYNTNYI